MKSITLAPKTIVEIALGKNERFEVLLSVGEKIRYVNRIRFLIAYDWGRLQMQLNEDRLVGLSGPCAGAYWRPEWQSAEVTPLAGVINRYEFDAREAGTYRFEVVRALMI